MLWMHGRTVSKELDPGRYLRWMRSGIATCSIDLPGHGERFDEGLQGPEGTLNLIGQAIGEIDDVLESLAATEHGGAFDLGRVGIGGMSAGGMVTLRRLCDPHGFSCASVEATTGSLARLYKPESGRPWLVDHPDERIAEVDPAQRLSGWRPIPLQVLHSEADKLVPYRTQRAFLDSLDATYRDKGADPALIEIKTWRETGAPSEHLGFGKVTAQAKASQLEFLSRHLLLVPS